VDPSESFDLVISDVKMPEVSGIELHAALQSVRPDLLDRLVFCTGEAESPAVASFVAETGCKVLLKPFDLKTLAAVSDDVAAQCGQTPAFAAG
ncbi:MAG TPA: response regulator, partial [Gemmatimonadaceae bacterium]|nr:response regulator [Gemmatimonadaceae bacterium]